MAPNQTSKFLHSQGNHKQHKKTTHRMGENLCKWINWQGINLQNLQIHSAAPYQKTNKQTNKQPHQKMGRRSKQAVLQRRHTDGQKNTWKDIQYHSLLERCKSKPLRGTTLNQPEWPSSKSLQTVSAGEGVEKKEPCYTVGGIVNWYNPLKPLQLFIQGQFPSSVLNLVSYDPCWVYGL